MERYERGEAQEDFVVDSVGGPDAVFRAVSRTVGKRWKAMSAADKRPYYQRAGDELERYRERMKAYNQKMVDSSDLAKKLAETQREQLEQNERLQEQLKAEAGGTRSGKRTKIARRCPSFVVLLLSY